MVLGGSQLGTFVKSLLRREIFGMFWGNFSSFPTRNVVLSGGNIGGAGRGLEATLGVFQNVSTMGR